MTKRELKKVARQKIREGKSRQVALQEIHHETNVTTERIAKILKFIPPQSTRGQYKILNRMLLAILLLLMVSKLLAGISFVMEYGIKETPVLIIFPLVNLILAVEVAKYKGEVYRIIVLFTILSMFRSLTMFSYNDYAQIDLIVSLILIILGFYLHSKFAPNYEIKREYFINELGERQGRDVIGFKD